MGRRYGGDGYYGGDMYILIPIPIPNWKSRGFPIPIPRQYGDSRQNGDEFGQYPREWVYLPFLLSCNLWGECLLCFVGHGLSVSVVREVHGLWTRECSQRFWGKWCDPPSPIAPSSSSLSPLKDLIIRSMIKKIQMGLPIDGYKSNGLVTLFS